MATENAINQADRTLPLSRGELAATRAERMDGLQTRPRAVPSNSSSSREIRIYSHSPLLYWWPVWLVGYAMAVVTYVGGTLQSLTPDLTAREWIHPSSNLGVAFFITLLMVILVSNFAVRGMAASLAIMSAILVTVVFAYAGWWDQIFAWFGSLKIHLTAGAYLWFSTLLLATWLVTVFGIDRRHCWYVTPGQITHMTGFGIASKSYNAQGMGLEKHREELFRHWVLGLGSGDLTIRTSGATQEVIEVRNVMFVNSKVDAMKVLIAEVPEGPAAAS